MTIKERFTVYTYGDNTVAAIFDNKAKSQISEIEAERICREEYGEHFNAKGKIKSDIIETMIKHIETYNESCQEGFEITLTDIIELAKNKLKNF